MRHHTLLLALLFPTAPFSAARCAAQLPHTAYPIDALHGVLGHWSPFGALSTGNSDESRTQHLIPAAFLPISGSLITALEIAPHMTGTVPYQSLQISLGHTSASTLGNDFTANLPSPTTVYAANDVSIDFPDATQWVSIPFQTMFIHDGASNLVIDIQKVIDRPRFPTVPHITHQMSSLPQRRDLPRPVFKDGIHGSGAATATSGMPYVGPPMLMRLLWIGGNTLTIDSTRTTGNYFRLGATVGLHVRAPADSVFIQFVDGRLAAQPLSAPGLVGLYWLPLRLVMLGAGVVGQSGVGDLWFGLPADAGLVDAHLCFQALLVTSMSVTNVVDAVVSQ